MKIGVSTYSFHSCAETLGMFGVLDKIREFGAEAVDFIPFSEDDPARETALAKEYGAYLQTIGLSGGCYCSGADLLAKDGDAQVKRVCRKVDIAKLLGCSCLRFDISAGFPKSVKVHRDYEACVEIAAPRARRIAEYAASVGLPVCTENHGRFSQDPERVERMIGAVGHENFGALVDIGNFLCADKDPAVSVGILAPYAIHVHAKDFCFRSGALDDPGEGWFPTRAQNYLKGAIVGHGCVPVKQCLRILKDAGFDGTVAIEFEGMEDPLLGVRVGVANLKRFLSMIGNA